MLLFAMWEGNRRLMIVVAIYRHLSLTVLNPKMKELDDVYASNV